MPRNVDSLDAAVLESAWGGALRTDFQHFSPRRVVALAATLAIVLSTLIASFLVARAAADAVVDPFNVICHAGGTEAPSGSHGNGTTTPCIDCCCAGCPIVLATPPVRTALRIVRSAQPVVVSVDDTLDPQPFVSRSHRSRAPPQNA
jgi:hypothetical protein